MPSVTALLAAAAAAAGAATTHTAWTQPPLVAGRRHHARRCGPLRAGVTPIGPFCPFHSSQVMDGVGRRMGSLAKDTPQFASEMARMQLDAQMGTAPDPARVAKLADSLDAAYDDWEELIARLSLSSDFQSREYFKLTEAQLQRTGQSTSSVGAMIKWQVEAMRAFGSGRMPPPPPANLEKMMEQAQSGGASPMGSLSAAQAITAVPFSQDSKAFKEPLVKAEYGNLAAAHSALIEMGGGYVAATTYYYYYHY
jgi:hypothetical protein